ncbi:winged helix-turn-helix domain-containing protein [Enterococcus sp. LJL90]
MKQILFLTQNLYTDNDWQDKFQKLGYEVFCSSRILDDFLSKKNFSLFNYFQYLVFSESISNINVQKIMKNLEGKNIVLFRIDNEITSSTDSSEEEYQEDVYFLNSRMSISEIRELFSKTQINEHFLNSNQISKFAAEADYISPRLIGLFFSSLSKKEQEFIRILFDNKVTFVQRKDLCKELWVQGASNSTLTQLSQIMGRVKVKLKQFDLSDSLIETHWTKGYALKPALYESLEVFFQDFK